MSFQDVSLFSFSFTVGAGKRNGWMLESYLFLVLLRICLEVRYTPFSGMELMLVDIDYPTFSVTG